MTLLERDKIIEAFQYLDRKLGQMGERAEIGLVDGAVMCIVHRARSATHDVDAWFSAPETVRKAASSVASELGLAEDWLNDAAKAFIPEGAGHERWRDYAHLSISTVDAATLLAMKCSAARTEVDAEDIRFLARHLGLTSAQAVLVA